MNKENEKVVISGSGISYYVIYDVENDGAGYGIYAEADNDTTDSKCVRKIFFTEEEAVLRCKWLCENQVYPVALIDTLKNII